MVMHSEEFKSQGFLVIEKAETKGGKAHGKNTVVFLRELLRARQALLDDFSTSFNQELVEEISATSAAIQSFCIQHNIEFDQDKAFGRINNIINGLIKENVMAKSTKKQEPVKSAPANKDQAEGRATRTAPKKLEKVELRKEEQRKEDQRKADRREAALQKEEKMAAKASVKADKDVMKRKLHETLQKSDKKRLDAEIAANKAPAAPAKAPSTPAPEPVAPVAVEAAPAYEPPCGGVFDADPSSSCFGMCKDESPEDFEVCLNHFNNILKNKTQTRRERSATSTKKKAEGTHTPRKFDRIGDGIGTSAHMINVMLLEGATLEEMEELIPVPRTRIAGHIAGLKSGNTRRGPKVVIKDPKTKRYHLDFSEGEPVCYFTII